MFNTYLTGYDQHFVYVCPCASVLARVFLCMRVLYARVRVCI